METKINRLGLLHDTCLKKVETSENGFHFVFSFYLEDGKEYHVELITNNIANVSCAEHYRDSRTVAKELVDLHEVDCIKVEKKGDSFEILLENIEKDTIIELHFSSTEHQLIGDTKELEEFWDIDQTIEE